MKRIALLFILTLVSVGLFAQGFKFSVGGAVGFFMDVQSFTVKDLPPPPESMERTVTTNILGGGLFVDGTYFVAGVDAQFSLGKGSVKSVSTNPDSTATSKRNLSTVALDLSFLGKYPFKLASGFSLAPAVGASYRLNLIYEDKDGDKKRVDLSSTQIAELNDILINAGLLADLDLSESVYLRGSLLFGYNLTTGVKEGKDAFEAMGAEFSTFGFVPSCSLGLGFKL